MFANTVALLALFVALGEGAYALSIRKNSVGVRELRSNAVPRAKIRDDAVTSAKVRDGSLRAIDFRPGELSRGRAGPAGPADPQGIQGRLGRSPVTRFARVKDDATLGAGSAGTTVARCRLAPWAGTWSRSIWTQPAARSARLRALVTAVTASSRGPR
jgi:hypothetical protein